MLENAQKILKKYYGYPTFREGQEKIIESILQGRDTLAIMPTGAGKSICFQIPALLFKGITLVISPLISLMKDQVDSLKSLGVPASFINSSLSQLEVEERIKTASQGKYKLLYVAPERLHSQGFLSLINSSSISLLAIDEAHCVSQWGHDFRPSYRSIVPFIQQLPSRPTVAAFTATATESVKQDITNLLSLRKPNFYITGFNRKNLSFSVIKGQNRKDFLVKYVEDNKEQSGIIYAATRKEVEKIHFLLDKKGYSIGKYHAGLSEIERTKSQEAFLYDDISIMVATNAFGMGINKSNVRYVIHYNIPKNMEAYYQEAGRAGRDGEPSECIILFGPQDILLQKYLLEKTLSSPERKINEYKKLQIMVDYCHTSKCLRKYILEYFGEESAADQCGNCSNCNDDGQLTDLTIEAQKIFSCVIRMKERYGVSLITEVLKGSKNKKVLQLGFNNLSTYGILKEYKLEEIKDLINLLIAEGYLRLTEGDYPVVKLEQKAIGVLKNKEKVFQKVFKRKEKNSSATSLFTTLRTLRKNISEREKVPPYIVFSDSTLREIAEHCPIDDIAMLSIKGVGELKLEKYGAEFLNAIREYLNQSRTESKKEDTKTPTHLLTLDMYKTGLSLEEIARTRSLKITTIQEHIIRCGAEGHYLDWDFFIPQEYESLILEKIKKLGAEKLRPIKDVLPDEVTYMAIKAVLAKNNLT